MSGRFVCLMLCIHSHARTRMQVSDEDWDDMMNVNARSALYGMQVAYPYFKQREVREFGLSCHVMSCDVLCAALLTRACYLFGMRPSVSLGLTCPCMHRRATSSTFPPCSAASPSPPTAAPTAPGACVRYITACMNVCACMYVCKSDRPLTVMGVILITRTHACMINSKHALNSITTSVRLEVGNAGRQQRWWWNGCFAFASTIYTPPFTQGNESTELSKPPAHL